MTNDVVNDLKQIGIPTIINGVDYNLIADLNALIDIKKKFENAVLKDGTDEEKTVFAELDGLEKGFELLKKGDYDAVRFFAYVMFRHNDENITEYEAGKIVGSSNFGVLLMKLIEAMTVSLPLTEEKNA